MITVKALKKLKNQLNEKDVFFKLLEDKTLLTSTEKEKFLDSLYWLTKPESQSFPLYYAKQFNIYDKAADKAKLKKNLKTVVGLLNDYSEKKEFKNDHLGKYEYVDYFTNWAKAFKNLLQVDINDEEFDPKLKDLKKIKYSYTASLVDKIGIYAPLRFT